MIPEDGPLLASAHSGSRCAETRSVQQWCTEPGPLAGHLTPGAGVKDLSGSL